MNTYIYVWVSLVILTGISISTAGMDWGRWGLTLALVIAFIKSGLILNYFMHLKDQKKIKLVRWMIPGIFVILVLFIGLTFLDVALR